MDLHSLTWEPPQMPTPGDSPVLSTVPVGSRGLCARACELGYSMGVRQPLGILLGPLPSLEELPHPAVDQLPS